MSRRRRKKGKGGAGIVVLLIAGLVGAGYYLRDCLNFGMGTGGGSGSGEQSASENPTSEDKPEGSAGTVAVVVKGETCSIEGKDAQPCPQACESLKAEGNFDKRIDVDGTLGAHEVVESLKKCLGEAGFKDVTLRSN